MSERAVLLALGITLGLFSLIWSCLLWLVPELRVWMAWQFMLPVALLLAVLGFSGRAQAVLRGLQRMADKLEGGVRR